MFRPHTDAGLILGADDGRSEEEKEEADVRGAPYAALGTGVEAGEEENRLLNVITGMGLIWSEVVVDVFSSSVPVFPVLFFLCCPGSPFLPFQCPCASLIVRRNRAESEGPSSRSFSAVDGHPNATSRPLARIRRLNRNPGYIPPFVAIAIDLSTFVLGPNSPAL